LDSNPAKPTTPEVVMALLQTRKIAAGIHNGKV